MAIKILLPIRVDKSEHTDSISITVSLETGIHVHHVLQHVIVKVTVLGLGVRIVRDGKIKAVDAYNV